MKPSSIMCASVIALASIAWTADGALASGPCPTPACKSTGGTHGPMGASVAQPTTCPPGQVLTTDPATGKKSCVAAGMIHKSIDVATPKLADPK